MATLLRGQRERPLNIEVGEELAAQLPDDFLVVANASLNSRHPQVEFDLVVIKPSAVFVTDMAEGRPPQRPNHSMRYSGPISRVRQKAMTFSRRLRSTEIASQIFGDPRVASSVWVLPILLVSREVDETPRSSAAGYRPAILSRHQAVQYIENPNVKGYHCKLYPHEIEQFGRLLAGIDERSFQVQEAIRAANLLMRAGDHESALERLTEVQAIAPLDMQDQVTGLFEAARRIKDMTAEADNLVQIGHFEKAIAIYEQVPESYPTSTRHKDALHSAHKTARTPAVWKKINSSVAALA